MKLFMTVGVILSLAAASGAQAAQPPVENGPVSKTHEVSKGETLWGLSNKYYGDPFKWGRIYNANMDKISNPDLIYPKEEIAIPEITEAVKHAPATAADVFSEEPAAAAVEKAYSPAAGKVNISDFEPMGSSMEMPVDQKEWPAGATTIVPVNWKADGVIISRVNADSDDENDSLTEPGDRVRVKVRKPSLFRPGERISAYMKGIVAYDSKTNKKLGRELQKTGVLEILSVNKNIVKARVLESNTSVDSGQVIKK